MEENIASTPGRTLTYQVIGSPFLAPSSGEHASKPQTDYRVDEQSLSTSGTRVNSPDASIHEGKEGHDIEKSQDAIDTIDIFDPNRPKFKLSRRM